MKLAIDIALLPPDHIMDLCIDVGKNCKQDIAVSLNKVDNLPHITLAMGVLDDTDFNIVIEELKNIVNNIQPIDLTISKLYSIEVDSGKFSYGFEIIKSPELVTLHTLVLDHFYQYLFKYKSSQDMFYIKDGEGFSNTSMRWVDTLYQTKYKNIDKYYPHISLKCQDPKYSDFPIKFTANRIALCHLGNHCTCRKILWEGKLK